MADYNSEYLKLIDDKNKISASQMVRAKFYLIKQYKYVDGKSGTFSDNSAPIIYTLFVSKTKDIVHAVKVSGISPKIIKKFFEKLINDETNEIEMRGPSKQIYSKIISRVPVISNDAYRTYKMSGLKKVIELDIDSDKLKSISRLKKEEALRKKEEIKAKQKNTK